MPISPNEEFWGPAITVYGCSKEEEALIFSMFSPLGPLFSWRFVKFCAVGSCGVLVNLGLLALFADGMGMNPNVASAVAIELSINSNFFINEAWTFRDRRGSAPKSRARRWARFHAVSLVGAIAQWLVFIFANFAWLVLLQDAAAVERYLGSAGGALDAYVIKPILDPPQVGAWKYLSQILGIGVATLWNYFANFYWTWGAARREE